MNANSVTMVPREQSVNSHSLHAGHWIEPRLFFTVMEDDDVPDADKRFDFIEDYVLKTLKLKGDRWQKCVSVEEQKNVLKDFLDKSEINTLVVSLNAAGQLVPSVSFPATAKNKAVYFVKRSKRALTVDTMKSNLFYGDLSYVPLEQFSALVEEVS